MHVCTVTPISINVGANRVVPAMAIPYPTGNIELEKEDEKLFRRHMLDRLTITAIASHQIQVPAKIPHISWTFSPTDSLPPILNMENTTIKDKIVAGLVIAITKEDRKQEKICPGCSSLLFPAALAKE